MALDAFGREIRPGDLIAVNAYVSVEVVREDSIKPKTVNGYRSMKVIIITEEIARGHSPSYFEARNGRTSAEVRDANIELKIQRSREIKEMCGIED